jgi:hypothetical protein
MHHTRTSARGVNDLAGSTIASVVIGHGLLHAFGEDNAWTAVSKLCEREREFVVAYIGVSCSATGL